ncbi:hypothetical protein AB3R30_21470 [Leptolyngbyaceae cyanobacterium UHCC 1019]
MTTCLLNGGIFVGKNLAVALTLKGDRPLIKHESSKELLKLAGINPWNRVGMGDSCGGYRDRLFTVGREYEIGQTLLAADSVFVWNRNRCQLFGL